MEGITTHIRHRRMVETTKKNEYKVEEWNVYTMVWFTVVDGLDKDDAIAFISTGMEEE